MKQPSSSKLKQELRDAGAAPGDATKLSQFATGLTRLQTGTPKLSDGIRWRPRRRVWSVLPAVALAGAGGLLAGLLLVALAQTSFPGSLLYPVKRASEAVALQTQPDYRGVLMMRRAQEVRELVSRNGSSDLVATTLHDYATDAIAYKAQTGQNYAAFRYCQANLQQAESQARGKERQQIAGTLAALPADIN